MSGTDARRSTGKAGCRAVLPVSLRAGQRARLAISPPPRAGLSLLEVILAVAILGGCLAVVGELIRLGSRQAEESRELTTAQLLCESKLEEIAAGVVAPEGASGVPFETDPRWNYSIAIATLDTADLIQVTVTAEQVDGSRLIPLTFSLTRWMIDPNLELELMALESQSSSQTSSSESGAATDSGTIPGGG